MHFWLADISTLQRNTHYHEDIILEKGSPITISEQVVVPGQLLELS
jgi:hypothetical protein